MKLTADAHCGAARGGGTPPCRGTAGGTPTRLRGRIGRLDVSDDDAGRVAVRGEVGQLDVSDDDAGRVAVRGEVGQLDVRGRRR
jgi:hypothetical protein